MSKNKHTSLIKNGVYPISTLFVAIGFLAIGYGMMMTFIGIYLKEIGSSDTVIGIINASFFAGAILSSIFSQKIISTVGHIRSFSVFAAIMVGTCLLHSVYVNELFWGVLRLISGFAYYGLLIILESWLNEKSQDEYRGQILAIYSIVFYLSTAIGQIILNIHGKIEKEFVFSLGSILVLISLVLISITKIKEPNIPPFERYSLPKIASVTPLALLGSFIAGFMAGGFFTMFPLYVINSLHSMENLVIFMTLSILGGLISQFPIGKLSDHYGRKLLILIVSFFITIVSILFLIYNNSLYLSFLLSGLIGMGIFCLYPLSVARANDVIDKNKDVIEISRTLLFIFAGGSFVAPLFIGICFNYFGYDSIFIIYAILGFILFLFALSREKVPEEQLTIFVEVPAIAASTLSQMDPRQDEDWVNEKSEYIDN